LLTFTSQIDTLHSLTTNVRISLLYTLSTAASQLDLEQLPGEGGLLYTRTDEKLSNNPLLLAPLGSHTITRAVIPYFNCFEEAYLHSNNGSLVLSFCKDDRSEHNSDASPGSGFKKKNKNQISSVCNVTINN